MLKQPSKILVVMGDSLSDSCTLGVLPRYLWPHLLGLKMRNTGPDGIVRGVDVQVANFARNGSTTAQQLTYMLQTTEHGTPDFAIIWGGANDAGAALTTAQTKANLAAMVKWWKFGCKGTAATEAALPIAAPGTRYIVLADGSSSGGIAAPSGQGLRPTITGAGGGAQTVWECRYSRGAEKAWGRVATASTVPNPDTYAQECDKIIIGGAQYLNYATDAGDNYNVDTDKKFNEGLSTDSASAGIKYAAYDTLRIAQAEVATAEGVEFCNTFNFFSRAIAAGLHGQGTFVEHYATGNQHHNRYGHSLLAEAFFQTAQDADWLD